MVYKYSLSVSGDNFNPEVIIKSVQWDFLIGTFFKPSDAKSINNSETYGYGSLAFWHPKKFSSEKNVSTYENDFVEFVEKNYHIFIENFVTDFEIYIEIYFDSSECNFEIFNRALLKRLAPLGMALPISVYVLSTEKLQKWEMEINEVWRGTPLSDEESQG